MLDRKDIISEYEQTGSIRAVARKLHLNRKTVKNYVSEYLEALKGGDETITAYLKSEPTYKTPIRQRRVLTGEVCELIDACLRDNAHKRQSGDHKLCMKASDIHAAVKNAGHKVSYPSVCKYIRTTLGHADELSECYIRQNYSPGQDCEFDWGEMYLTIDGRRTKLYMAVFTMAYSNFRTAYLYLHQDTQAYLESHRRYFNELGYVPRRMVYDNMRVAVASFVGEKRPTDALIRLEATYGFTHRFCNIRSGNEKGHVERSVEVVRRRAFCQEDTFESILAAECQIVEACAELNTPLGLAEGSAEQKIEEEYPHMLPLRKEIGCFEMQRYTVDKYGTIVLKGVHYSVPDNLVDKKVNVMIYSNKLKIYHNKQLVAEQERTPVNGWKIDIMHYLPTLMKKPGAVAGSVALHQSTEGLKDIFRQYFADSPCDFIALLQKVRDHGLSPKDIEESRNQLLKQGIHPSLEAFCHSLFGEDGGSKELDEELLAITSADIEAHAEDDLSRLTVIMNSNSSMPYVAGS